MKEVIDVALPVRNEAGMVARTLRSIHAQIVDEEYLFHVSVLPNACTDQTYRIARKTIDELEKSPHPRITYELKYNSQPGKIRALNRELSCSNTAIFMYVDGDAILSPNCFSAVTARLKQDGIYVSGAVSKKIITPDTNDTVKSFHRLRAALFESLQSMGRWRQPMGAMLAFRRNILDRLPPEALAEDFYIVLLAASKYGLKASCIAAEASVYTVGTKTMEDYMNREERIWTTNMGILASYPHLRTPYLELYRYFPPEHHEIKAILMPRLKSLNLEKRHLDEWQAALGKTMAATDSKKYLRTDGTWMPALTTKTLTR